MTERPTRAKPKRSTPSPPLAETEAATRLCSGADGPPAAADAAPDYAALLLERIRDYRAAALESDRPEIAVIGGVAADLAELNLLFSDGLKELAAACESPRQFVENDPRPLEQMLKLSRQIDRYMRLEHDIRRDR